MVRLYTQNIDGLESVGGLSDDKIVCAHGSFGGSVKCSGCAQEAKMTLDEYKEVILTNGSPRCDCSRKAPLKPDIVFFGENLPERFYMHTEDILFSDYLLCMGTSLEV